MCNMNKLNLAVIYLMYVSNPHFLLVGCMGTSEAGPSHVQWSNVLRLLHFMHFNWLGLIALFPFCKYLIHVVD